VGLENRVAEAEKLTHPLLMHIAEEDQFVPKAAQEVILAALKDHPQVEIHTYPGCDHAFAREGGEHYNAEAAKLANGRTLSFFAKVLG
jgi:carboxymethylenebutenolidase